MSSTSSSPEDETPDVSPRFGVSTNNLLLLALNVALIAFFVAVLLTQPPTIAASLAQPTPTWTTNPVLTVDPETSGTPLATVIATVAATNTSTSHPASTPVRQPTATPPRATATTAPLPTPTATASISGN